MTVRRTGEEPVGQKNIHIGGMHGSQTFEKLLLQLSLGDLNLDSPVNLLLVTALVVGVVLDGGGEQGVDESRFS
jgi:hypothetical protein